MTNFCTDGGKVLITLHLVQSITVCYFSVSTYCYGNMVKARQQRNKLFFSCSDTHDVVQKILEIPQV